MVKATVAGMHCMEHVEGTSFSTQKEWPHAPTVDAPSQLPSYTPGHRDLRVDACGESWPSTCGEHR